jgi:cbb3-type cytochrome oxidase cytochrome c subunit
MRSSDETYYNINRLHIVFAIASALLIGVTVWMFVVDHRREWKQYQRTYQDRVQPWLAESQLAQRETAAFAHEEAELRAALEQATAAIPAAEQLEQFTVAARAAGDEPGATAVDKAYTSLLATPSKAQRRKMFEELEAVVTRVEQQRDELERQRRADRARFDKARSEYEVAAGRGAPTEELATLQEATTRIQQKIDGLAIDIETKEADRQRLADLLASITAEEDAAQDALERHLAEVEQFRRTLASLPDEAAETLSRMPFVDAFGRSLAVEQIWLPELTIDYNFQRVARFDRCITCHQGIDQVQPRTPNLPAIVCPKQLTVSLATPDDPPDESEQTLESLYGLTLAPRGILVDDQPTISVVAPESAAAWAGLYSGDAIRAIDGEPISNREAAIARLLQPATWGEPLQLTIERGLSQPYCGHPRLDLLVGSKSPHPMVDFGCTICHAGQGSATEFKFASHSPNSQENRQRWSRDHDWFQNEHWDFPMLEQRFLESSCLQCHHEVTDLEPTDRFSDPPAPKLLAGYHLIRENGCFGCHEISGFDPAGNRIGPDLRLEPSTIEAAKQVEQDGGIQPGTMRKVGPSLRDVADRLDDTVLDRWIADPIAIRPTTRMPQFFGLHEHLQGEELQKAMRYEAVEVGAIRTFLRDASQTLDLLPTPSEVTEEPSADRGEELFVQRGCVACHRHEDVPEGQSTVGPDLTGLGSMITTESGRAWLTSWIRDPVHHSPRTPMPNALLEPEPLGGDTDDGRRRMSDPAADLASYLLESTGEPLEPFPPLNETDLDALARSHLIKQFPSAETDEILARGIPAEMASSGLGDAVELLAPISKEKKLRYVGRRTIRKRGCFGCHDIPGFEEAQLIGPALTDWGRKQESLLAFEQVHRFLEQNPPGEADGSAADRDFYLEAISSGRREGFLWQKLRQPRSFDFRKTEHKGYHEQLTMGLFSFTPAEREQIMTFVLGLTADPPSERYVYSPDRRTKAIADGRKVLDQYGCAECHTMQMDRWRFRYDPEWWEGPIPPETFDFVQPSFTPEAVTDSLVRDRTGWGQAEVIGRPLIDPSGEIILDEDDDGNPLYVFSLWKPALINGEAWPVGGAQVPVSEPHITHRYPAWGGAFAQLLYPYAAEEAGASWLEAWGQVPPALVNEGSLVQPDWLYGYLLNPTPIRPSVLLRMPKYNLSSAEAATLVDYFAAASNAGFPYTSASLPQTGSETNHGRAALMDQAMRLVIDRKTYCAKCHLIGDFDPGGETQTILAPNLAEVGRRIRPEYLRRWLADPKSVLPYTGMPVNFPPEGPPMGQDLLPGSSREQLDAVHDLLLHYDAYLQRRTSIRAMIDGAGSDPDASMNRLQQ